MDYPNFTVYILDGQIHQYTNDKHQITPLSRHV